MESEEEKSVSVKRGLQKLSESILINNIRIYTQNLPFLGQKVAARAGIAKPLKKKEDSYKEAEIL